MLLVEALRQELNRIDSKLDLLIALTRKEIQVMSALDDTIAELQADVTAETTVTANTPVAPPAS